MSKVFKGLPRKVLSSGQEQCLKNKDFQVPTIEGRDHSRSMGHFQEYILDCPHHGMEDWLLMQSFYHGLSQKAHEQLDATAGGSFMSLTLGKLKLLWKR